MTHVNVMDYLTLNNKCPISFPEGSRSRRAARANSMAAATAPFHSVLAAPSTSRAAFPAREVSRRVVLGRRWRGGGRGGGGGGCRAMAQEQAFQGPSAAYAKQMERLSAKESLLIALQDAGGFESLVSGKTTEMQKIDVNERIVGLERLNPTPRPTTSPYLEGSWNFEWFGAGSPGLYAAKVLFERSPIAIAKLSALTMLIKDSNSKVTANMIFLNSIEEKFILTTKLSVEGPIRMKEEYEEGILETPNVSDEAIPQQLKGAIGQATGALQQLPELLKDALTNGLKIPLSNTFRRLFLISYLDEEILIIRDASGAADVLTRLEAPPEPVDTGILPDYES